MKRLLNICLVAALLAFSGCSDDEPDMTSQVTGPLYGLKKGAAGSVDELIYNIWEGTGVYYLYNFERDAFLVSNFSGYFGYDYTPVAPENTEAVRLVVKNIQDKVFKGMDNDFIHRNWFVRVFLCDELTNSSGNAPADPYVVNSDALIVHNVNADVLTRTDVEWDTWAGKFSDLLNSRLYLGATEQPTAFFDLRPKKSNGTEIIAIYKPWTEDPDGRYSPNVYTFRSYGYVRSKANFIGPETVFVVDQKADISDYITFLTKTTKEELDWNWAKFPAMKKRAAALIPYLIDVLNLPLEEMQNANVPDDPVPTGYYRNFTE